MAKPSLSKIFQELRDLLREIQDHLQQAQSAFGDIDAKLDYFIKNLHRYPVNHISHE